MCVFTVESGSGVISRWHYLWREHQRFLNSECKVEVGVGSDVVLVDPRSVDPVPPLGVSPQNAKTIYWPKVSYCDSLEFSLPCVHSLCYQRWKGKKGLYEFDVASCRGVFDTKALSDLPSHFFFLVHARLHAIRRSIAVRRDVVWVA